MEDMLEKYRLLKLFIYFCVLVLFVFIYLYTFIIYFYLIFIFSAFSAWPTNVFFDSGHLLL